MMKYLHTMLRVANLEKALHFYCEGMGFKQVRREEREKEKYTLVFLRAPGDSDDGPLIELTYNWGKDHYERGNAYGHLAYRVESMKALQERLKDNGYDLSWGPEVSPSGRSMMAFVDDPDGYEIELLERLS